MPRIKCFDTLSNPGIRKLKDEFDKLVTEDMPEAEQRAIGTKIATDYHKQLHGELSNFKKSLGIKSEPYKPIDNTPAIEKIKSDYQAKIDEVKASQPKAIQETFNLSKEKIKGTDYSESESSMAALQEGIAYPYKTIEEKYDTILNGVANNVSEGKMALDDAVDLANKHWQPNIKGKENLLSVSGIELPSEITKSDIERVIKENSTKQPIAVKEQTNTGKENNDEKQIRIKDELIKRGISEKAADSVSKGLVKALEDKDIAHKVLHPRNTNSREIWSKETGMTLPKTVGGTKDAIEAYFIIKDGGLKPFEDIVNSSDTFQGAFDKVKKLTSVSKEVAKAFADKYDPKRKLTAEQAFEKFYNETKSKKTEPTNVEEQPKTEVTNGNEPPPAEPPKPPIEPPKTPEGEGIGVTHADTEAMRKETGLPEYEKTPQTLELWNAEADKRINNGEMPTLIKKLENGGSLAEGVEQTMMGKYIAALDAEVTKNPSKENIEKFDKAMHLNEVAGSLGFGQVGRARQQTFLPENSLGKSLLDEAQSLGISAAELPKEVKDKVIAEHEELAKIRVELEKANEENTRLQNELAAKEEVSKIRKATKKTNKTAADFVAERKTLKDELIAAKEKHEKWLKDNGIQMAGFGFTLTGEMAKIIGKMIKSHAEQTVIKFDELVNNVFNEIKDVFEGLEKRDIIDVMRGVYNEKRPTRNEAVARLRDLKSETVWLKRLEDERLGKKAETVQQKSKKAVRLTELENKIKEIRERNKDKDPVEKTDGERLAAKRKVIQEKIDEITEDVKAGRLGNEKRLPPIRLDKKTEALQDRLITLETQQKIRREKADYEKMSKLNKAADTFWQLAGLRRLVNSAIDFSILFRQASPITMNIMKYLPRIENGKLVKNTAPRAIANMFNLAFTPKGFKRFQYNLEKSELGRMYNHFNGVFSNPTEVKMEKREEEFTNNLLPRIRQKIDASDNNTLKRAAEILDKAWFSERASAGLLNTIRIEEFTKGVKNLERQGITPENSPQHYKDLVKWTMNLTGRGNMLKMLEDSHAGRIAANRTYFGARLFAAKVNMLNPITYIRMPKEVRVQALKDIAGNVTTMVLVGLAAQAAGASVSFNPDDSDFLQVRFNDKVYDITGGSVAYVRTFLRTAKASVMQISNPGSKAANSYTGFAGRSAWNSLFANKLSPNTAYAYHFFTGKSGEYDEKGKKKPFDPAEIAEIYPLYVDGTIEAYKKGGVGDALSILIPDLFGIGTQQYEDREDKAKSETRKKLPSWKQLQEQ